MLDLYQIICKVSVMPITHGFAIIRQTDTRNRFTRKLDQETVGMVSGEYEIGFAYLDI